LMMIHSSTYKYVRSRVEVVALLLLLAAKRPHERHLKPHHNRLMVQQTTVVFVGFSLTNKIVREEQRRSNNHRIWASLRDSSLQSNGIRKQYDR
jgi:hypothetical protein